MIGAILEALSRTPKRWRQGLYEVVHESMKKNMGSRRKMESPPEDANSFSDWTKDKLIELQAPQIKNIQQSTYTYMVRLRKSAEKSKDPKVSVVFNTLYLPNTTASATQSLVDYMYSGKLPELPASNTETLLTICHTHVLAAFLQMYDCANHCMDTLISAHALLRRPAIAAAILKHAIALENERSRHWHKLQELLLDVTALADGFDPSDDEAVRFGNVLEVLELRSSKYLSKALRKHNQRLKRQLSDVYRIIKQENNGQDRDELPGIKVEIEQIGDGITADGLNELSDKSHVCLRYHWHSPGTGCFPDTIRAVDVQALEAIPSREQSQNRAMTSTSKPAGMKRKVSEIEDNEDAEDIDEGEEEDDAKDGDYCEEAEED